MVEEATYRRFHLNFLRIHRQAMMGNERRYFYDYYMVCCGPSRSSSGSADGERRCGLYRRGGLDRSVAGGGAGKVRRARAVTATISKFVWLGFSLLWSVLRCGRDGARARRRCATPAAIVREIVLLGCSLTGLGIVPYHLRR